MTEDELQTGIRVAHMQALKSLGEGGVPVGAALMLDGAVISVGHNRRVQNRSNVLHGETDCIERAGHGFDLGRAAMFTTLAPCLMCTGAIRLFGIPTVVVLDDVNTGDFENGMDQLLEAGVEVIVERHKPTIDMMTRFQNDPETGRIWKGDIGK